MNLFKVICRGAGELSPSCREAARLQSLALDRPLRPSQRLGLRLHLLLCKWCRRYGRQISFLREVASKQDAAGREPSDRTLSPETRERIRRRLQSLEK